MQISERQSNNLSKFQPSYSAPLFLSPTHSLSLSPFASCASCTSQYREDGLLHTSIPLYRKWLTCPEWRSLAEERWGETGQVSISVAEGWRRDWIEGDGEEWWWGALRYGGGWWRRNTGWVQVKFCSILLHLLLWTSLFSVIPLFLSLTSTSTSNN